MLEHDSSCGCPKCSGFTYPKVPGRRKKNGNGKVYVPTTIFWYNNDWYVRFYRLDDKNFFDLYVLWMWENLDNA